MVPQGIKSDEPGERKKRKRWNGERSERKKKESVVCVQQGKIFTSTHRLLNNSPQQ